MWVVPSIGALGGVADHRKITYCLSTLIPVFCLDKYGRRRILYIGAVLQALAMAAAGALSYLSENGYGNGYGKGATACIFIFTFVFGASWVRPPPPPSCYLAEAA